ncbi:MAG: RidA family protein [Spirochaetaceae bacterium]|jgi:2-iminobutanoate/2-iminopropanoate deaminase|nr:RidA family protein [Spirochaetaceae bacterium]
MKVVQTDASPAAIGPYSQAFISGNFVFTSGQIPLDPKTGEVAGGDIGGQTGQAIANLGAVLEAAGSSLGKVIKTTCFLADMNDFARFNEVYAKHFPGKPARSTIAVRQLPKNVLVEIEAVAEL